MSSALDRRLKTLEGIGGTDRDVVFYANLTAFTDERLMLMSRCSTRDGKLDFAFFDSLTPAEQAELKAALDDVEAQRLAWEQAGRPPGCFEKGFAHG